MPIISLELNGKQLSREVSARTHLADFLRDEALLTGTHLGCEHGVCGACTVLIDNQPIRSCTTFAVACDGAMITTIEGYEEDPVMALLREAFSRHHALQCGFCTPGMLATARDIVLRVPDADEARIRLELSGNLCRCTGYMGIVAAIRDVLEQTQGTAHPAIAVIRAKKQTSDTEAVRSHGFASFEAIDIGKVVETKIPEGSVTPIHAADSTPPDSKGGTRIKGAFMVPFSADAVWQFMGDLSAVAGCLPGAELIEHNDERVKGRVSVKFGPMAASFNGAARLERNDVSRSAVLRGSGLDSLSQSRANGDVAYQLTELKGEVTRVDVDLLYSLQGPLAQFSRSGLVKDFVGRLIQEFGKNVASRMDPRRAGDAPLQPEKLNAISLGLSILWMRIRRWFGVID